MAARKNTNLLHDYVENIQTVFQRMCYLHGVMSTFVVCVLYLQDCAL